MSDDNFLSFAEQVGKDVASIQEKVSTTSITIPLEGDATGSITLRKTSGIVTVEVDKLTSSGGAIGTIPVGFRPYRTLYIYAFDSISVDLDGARVGITTSGSVTHVGADSGRVYYGTGVYTQSS